MDLEPLSALFDVRHRCATQPKRLSELVLAQLRFCPRRADAVPELDVEAVDLQRPNHDPGMTVMSR